jgi:hypothetical protein
VDGPGDQLLAGAGFPFQHHGGVTGGDIGQHAGQADDGRADPDNLLGSAFRILGGGDRVQGQKRTDGLDRPHDQVVPVLDDEVLTRTVTGLPNLFRMRTS